MLQALVVGRSVATGSLYPCLRLICRRTLILWVTVRETCTDFRLGVGKCSKDLQKKVEQWEHPSMNNDSLSSSNVPPQLLSKLSICS